MRYIITGERGFVASYLKIELARLGHVFVDPPEGLRRRRDMDEVDATSEVALYSWLLAAKADYVIHAAALAGSERGNVLPYVSIDSNLKTTVAVLNVAKTLRVPVVYISTSAVYKPANHPLIEEDECLPLNVYNVTKYAGELLVRGQSEVPWLVLRPSLGFGNHLNSGLIGYPHSTLDKLILAKREQWNEPFKVALNPKFRKSYILVEDLAYALAKVIVAFPEHTVVNVGHPTAYPFGDLLNALGYISEADFPKQVTYLPEDDFLEHHVLDLERLRRFVGERWKPRDVLEYLEALHWR